ncbi:LLM class flavin-dependent oxidoreductase [Nocardiopsis ansamitocini]|uniref:Alkanesulfonate monooxygenase n=1 Tax=Nocardiopsis ansamitocini TaxID=1670832 RepID=A0A9W6P235_9ACTN|nr:LLM class flavin-dependent oxidoreductase [Nocardiopsis ansamitocini]GLU45696.1 alkanesulfonate monooxygenase [Nocardiopsis ansamitocini]
MTELLLRLPTRHGPPTGLGPVPRDVRADHYGPLERLFQTGRAAETAGLGGVLVPHDPLGEESWTVAAGLLRHSRHLRVVAEFHPGFATPVYAAKMAVTLQRFSAQRLGWRPALDGDAAEHAAQGDFLSGPDRYRRADEFLTAAKGVWTRRPFSFEGRFYRVLEGGFDAPLTGWAFPRVYLSGTGEEALELSARHADVHLLGPADDIKAVRAELAGRSARWGRDVELGVELSVLARDDTAEARADAGSDAGPHWEGFAGLGHTLPSGLVGSYDDVAALFDDYARRGVRTFSVEALPALPEAYRLGERLLPALAEQEQARVR